MNSRLPIAFVARLTAACLLTAPLAACGFDKFDGRWVANVPPTAECCPSHVLVDVDGHKFSGSVDDCNGTQILEGHVDGQGQATLHTQGKTADVKFAGVNFTTTLPGDRCRRVVTGNRGG